MTKSTARAKSSAKKPIPVDAIALLKADHREVSGWFKEFEAARKASRKKDLAVKICAALRIHTRIEEEIFYPAFLAATKDRDMNDEALVEHDGAKKLIGEIENSGPGEELYDAQVHVLSEMIKHHVKEEEQPGGMFAEAKKSKMDLKQIGMQMAERKSQLANQKKA